MKLEGDWNPVRIQARGDTFTCWISGCALLQRSRADWNAESRSGRSRWCIPADHATIERARAGDWEVILTPNLPVPRAWFGEVRGREVLCLASGGGQQAPVLRSHLSSRLECLRRGRAPRVGGVLSRAPSRRRAPRRIHEPALLPLRSRRRASRRPARRQIPAPLLRSRHPDPAARERWRQSGLAAEFSHSLAAQIGGQLAAGFVLTALYEDGWSDAITPLNRYTPMYLATRAMKPAWFC